MPEGGVLGFGVLTGPVGDVLALGLARFRERTGGGLLKHFGHVVYPPRPDLAPRYVPRHRIIG